MEEGGGRTIPVAYLIAISFVLGLVVLLAHPGYRAAALGILRGERDASPIWMSNDIYYPEVAIPQSELFDAE